MLVSILSILSILWPCVVFPLKYFNMACVERNATNEIEYFVVYEMKEILYLLWEIDLYLDNILEKSFTFIKFGCVLSICT